MSKKEQIEFSERVAKELLGWTWSTIPVKNVYESYDRPAWRAPSGAERVLPDFSRDWGAIEQWVLPLLRERQLSVAAFMKGALWEVHVHSARESDKTCSFTVTSDYVARGVCSAALKATSESRALKAKEATRGKA